MLSSYSYPMISRKELIQFLPKNYKKVLEIGCGSGGFSQTLKPGIEIWGVEPNLNAAKQAESNGYKVLVGFYDEVANQCPNSYFDLIICNDVIEHMADYESFLELVKSKLNAHGHIVGSIPNVRYFGNLFKLLIKKDWKYEDQGVLDQTHLRFFTEKSLTRTFIEHNYSVERLNGINSDFGKDFTIKQILRNIVLFCIIVFSFGYYKDIQWIQFGFRVKCRV